MINEEIDKERAKKLSELIIKNLRKEVSSGFYLREIFLMYLSMSVLIARHLYGNKYEDILKKDVEDAIEKRKHKSEL